MKRSSEGSDIEAKKARSSSTLYLDTVNRSRLDFDFEKLCCVSLSTLNVYACLVCGRYFQGRGKASHAYFHSMQDLHHVFINTETLKVYILPDSYEVADETLSDIKYVLKPTFTRDLVEQLDRLDKYSYDLNNKRYLPGYVGLNNIKANDYINVVLQSLAHIRPLRDFFLLQEPTNSSELVKRFGMLLRKMWNPRAFKGQVSPHELLQEINSASSKRFKLTEQLDPSEFLAWFLNSLQKGLKKNKIGIINQSFQGEVRVEEQKLVSVDKKQKSFDVGRDITTNLRPFMFLTLDLPTAPLYQDEHEKNIIPQIPINNLLSKYDGATFQETTDSIKRHRILSLPPYLIFHIKRFTKKNWAQLTSEKNPTIVTFPMKSLDMRDYVENPTGVTKYDLIANIVHDGLPNKGEYKAFVRGREKWFLLQDLFVDEVDAHVVLLAESYIQIWKRQDV